MTARVLQLIAANEAWLGRSLAEPRIIRITYDPDGAEITVRRSDGSVLSDEFRTNAPWVIEVEGTFAWGDHREIGTEQEPVATTPIEALAVRAYVTYPRDSSRSDRDLAELYHFPCWAAGLPPDDEVMDSVGCDPP
jgi:hypothetical protein